MKIAFFVYPSAFQSLGGGEILLLKTKEALEEKGVYVKLFDQWNDKLKDFDILHVFGGVKECLGLMRIAKALGVKIVLSPVFWSTMQRGLYEYGSFSKKSNMVLRHLIKLLWPAMPSARREMHLLADIIAPNSEAEAQQVKRLLAIEKSKMRIVYLGADKKFSDADSAEFIAAYNIKDFILSIGRIEPRKNQLNLIKANKGTGRKIVFIGDAVSGYGKYYNECVQRAGKEALFIPRIEHESSLLASAYAACDVFVLQAWFETPGLVALEAGLAGAKLVVTRGGSTSEYFKDYVEYLNPADVNSIRSGIDNALGKKKTSVLKNHIMNNFLWDNTADENIRIYKEILQ